MASSGSTWCADFADLAEAELKRDPGVPHAATEARLSTFVKSRLMGPVGIRVQRIRHSERKHHYQQYLVRRVLLHTAVSKTRQGYRARSDCLSRSQCI